MKVCIALFCVFLQSLSVDAQFGFGGGNPRLPGVGLNAQVPGVGGINAQVPGAGGLGGIGGLNAQVPGVGGINAQLPGVGGINAQIPGAQLDALGNLLNGKIF